MSSVTLLHPTQKVELFGDILHHLMPQDAQMPQRDCAMLRVIEYLAKSLKVIRNDTVE